jgi:hypothetical protein
LRPFRWFGAFLSRLGSGHGWCRFTVVIGNERVNVTISEKPKVIAGNKNAVGIGDVLRAVKKHRVKLIKEWDETRPDDQKLENSRAHKAKAAREAKD